MANDAAFIHFVERVTIFFKGGVRRSILIFCGICILLLYPTYYLGIFSSGLIRRTWIDEDLAIVPKTSVQADVLVSDTNIVELVDNQRDLYLTLDNKENPNIGFNPYNYRLRVLDEQGLVVKDETRQSYILPGDIKFVTTRDETGRGVTLDLEVLPTTQAVDYNPIKNPFQILPDVEIINEVYRQIDQDTLEVSALLANRDKFSIGEVEITYILRDRREQITGIGTVFFNGFAPDTTRDFFVEQPIHSELDVQFVDVRWSTNFLDDDNLRL